MDTLDPLQQWQELSEVYRGKSEGELEAMAETAYDLTDIARQALRAEISARNLDLQLREAPSPDELSPDPDLDPIYNEERDISAPTWVCKVESRLEAQQAKELLRDAGIVSYFGEDTTDPNYFPTDFSQGVDLLVSWVDAQRAGIILRRWMPSTDTSVEPDESAAPVLCPACKSDEIVLLRVLKKSDDDPDSKFRWRCDACAHTWIDDGIEEGSINQEPQ
jgi:DNA-directed RNA polymerase subunit M/transcription elongation factor TFIIS